MTSQAEAQQLQPEEGIEPDDLDAKMIVAIGLISTALLVASVLGVTALVDRFESKQVSTKVYQAGPSITYGNPDDVYTSQQQGLSGYDKALDSPGRYLIPIDRAKELVVKELSAPTGSASPVGASAPGASAPEALSTEALSTDQAQGGGDS
ncbi:MAG: hypothetical protein AAF589_06720 [Planctomycetota bacterium]